MAKNAKNIFQYKTTVSVSRDALRKAADYTTLKKDDYRVMLLLMTSLESKSPMKVSAKSIADELNLTKKDVKKSIDQLCWAGILTERSAVTGEGFTIFDDDTFYCEGYASLDE